ELESLLFNEAQEVRAEFLEIEGHAEILHAQDAALIDDRGEKSVVDAAVCRLAREHAVAARHLVNSVRRSGEEGPAGKIGAECLRILLEHLRRVAFGIDGDRDEVDLLAKGRHRADPARRTSSA